MNIEPRLSRRTLLAGLVAAPVVSAVLGACSDGDGGPVARPADDADLTLAGGSSSTAPGAGSNNVGSTVAAADDGYFPPAASEWETIDAASAGFTPRGIAAIARLIEETNGNTYMLVQGGRIVDEQYWGSSADTAADVASVQKSFTSTLLGIARAKGLVDFDDPVSSYLDAGWTNASPDEEAAITIRHLLTMTSGLDERTLSAVSAPGERWAYNTDAYQKLRRVLEAVASTDINTLTSEWLFGPIGIDNPEAWRPRPGGIADAAGDELWGLNLRAREMARFGLLAARRGSWNSDPVTEPEWFDEAWTPIPQKRDYGYLWWLVGNGTLRRAGAPADTVAALGARDQKIYVVPSLDLVLTRQGEAANEVAAAQSDFDRRLIRALVAARA